MEGAGILRPLGRRRSRVLMHALLLVALVVPGTVVGTTILAGPASAECRIVHTPPPAHLECGGGEEDPGDDGDGPGPGNPGEPERVPYDTYQTPACMLNGPPPNGGDAMCTGATATCVNQGGGIRMRIYYQWEQNGPWELVATRCVGGEEDDEPAPPTPEVIRQWLIERYLPKGSVGLSPPNGRTLVGLDTILYAEGETTYNRTVPVEGTSVTVNARVVRYVWHTGDGTFTTTNKGVAYEAGQDESAYVTHTYTETTAPGQPHDVRVDFVWEITSYTIGGVEGPPLGELTTPGEQGTPVTVLEADSRITR